MFQKEMLFANVYLFGRGRKPPREQIWKIHIINRVQQIVTYKWDKVFKNGPNKICGRQPLKIRRNIVCLNRSYLFKFIKGCLPQILFGPFLNTLSKIYPKMYCLVVRVLLCA